MAEKQSYTYSIAFKISLTYLFSYYHNFPSFHPQNFRLKILYMSRILYEAALYENISDKKILHMWKI